MTNMENKSRFAERTTIVKGFTIDTASDNMEKVPFEIETAYVRANDRAAKMAAETLGVADNNDIIVKVQELINEKPETIKYNNGKVFERASAVYDNAEEANNNVVDDLQTVIKIDWYEYSGAIWYKQVDQYFTEFVYDDSPLHLTKPDQKTLLFTRFNDMHDNLATALAIDDVKRVNVNRYCVIDKSELDNCIIEDK